jgi:DUF1009 family protein
MPEMTAIDTRSETIGIIAGFGSLPQRVIAYCQQHQQSFFVIYIEESSKETPEYIFQLPHKCLRIGEVGKALKILKENDISCVTFAGKVPRVSFKSLKVDFAGARLLANITRNLSRGDNVIFCQIVKFFEKNKIKVVGAHEVAPSLLSPEGVLGSVKPSKNQLKDIAYGQIIAHGVGNLDIGQSVVIQDGMVLGVEAAEGTDNLIIRCQSLQNKGKGAVLVKMKKPNQDERIDMPTIGVRTVINAAEAGFSGLAVEAGGALVIDLQAVIAEANGRRMFLVGV